MTWNINKAKVYMFDMGLDHIRDGLFVEGAELICEAKWRQGCNSESSFYETIKRICWWTSDSINDAIKEVNNVSDY